jgi:hypothetical protein
VPAPTVLPRQGALELGPQVVEVVGDHGRLHALAGPALVRRADQVAQPPGAPGAVVGVAQRATSRSRSGRASAAVAARTRNSSADHSSSPWAGSSPPRYAASTAWKLAPPKPTALTAERRSSPTQGRAASPKTNGLVFASYASFGSVMLRVGSSTPRCGACAAL